jgi:hypothetical protein
MKCKEKISFLDKKSIKTESGNPYKIKTQEMELTNTLEKEGFRLGLLFNGLQQRVNYQTPLALFTDKKTKTTFGVELGQNLKSKLKETRKKFRSFKDQRQFSSS